MNKQLSYDQLDARTADPDEYKQHLRRLADEWRESNLESLRTGEWVKSAQEFAEVFIPGTVEALLTGKHWASKRLSREKSRSGSYWAGYLTATGPRLMKALEPYLDENRELIKPDNTEEKVGFLDAMSVLCFSYARWSMFLVSAGAHPNDRVRGQIQTEEWTRLGRKMLTERDDLIFGGLAGGGTRTPVKESKDLVAAMG